MHQRSIKTNGRTFSHTPALGTHGPFSLAVHCFTKTNGRSFYAVTILNGWAQRSTKQMGAYNANESDAQYRSGFNKCRKWDEDDANGMKMTQKGWRYHRQNEDAAHRTKTPRTGQRRHAWNEDAAVGVNMPQMELQDKDAAD